MMLVSVVNTWIRYFWRGTTRWFRAMIFSDKPILYIPASSKGCISSAFSGKTVFHPKCNYFWPRAIFQQLHVCQKWVTLMFFQRPFYPTKRPSFFEILSRLANDVFSAKSHSWADNTKILVVSNKRRNFAHIMQVPGNVSHTHTHTRIWTSISISDVNPRNRKWVIFLSKPVITRLSFFGFSKNPSSCGPAQLQRDFLETRDPRCYARQRIPPPSQSAHNKEALFLRVAMQGRLQPWGANWRWVVEVMSCSDIIKSYK